MRIVIDEDIPRELTPLFRGSGHTAAHVEDLGLKGMRNSELLAAVSATADVFVTGDTNLGHQQNLRRFDVAIILIHPQLLVIDRIRELIPAAIEAYATARKARRDVGRDTCRSTTTMNLLAAFCGRSTMTDPSCSSVSADSETAQRP